MEFSHLVLQWNSMGQVQQLIGYVCSTWRKLGKTQTTLNMDECVRTRHDFNITFKKTSMKKCMTGE